MSVSVTVSQVTPGSIPSHVVVVGGSSQSGESVTTWVRVMPPGFWEMAAASVAAGSGVSLG